MPAEPGAAGKRRVEEQRKAAPAHIESQQQQGRQQHRTEEGVQKAGQAGPGVAHGPQEVVKEAQGRAGGGDLGKLDHLKEDRLFHTQPKSRAKKPPPVGCSSS